VRDQKEQSACQSEKPKVIVNVIEGLRAKRAYVAFWVDFYFLQDRANFWQTDLF